VLSNMSISSILIFFFFQAEDGIRDGHVTGVQTCALPISKPLAVLLLPVVLKVTGALTLTFNTTGNSNTANGFEALYSNIGTENRSEERRVGKEWREQWSR